MKKRTGFVSNSSSSSFICQVSGESYGGWDAGLSDFDLCECENGHVFHTSYAAKPLYSLTKDDIINYINEEINHLYLCNPQGNYIKGYIEEYNADINLIREAADLDDIRDELYEKFEWDTGYEVPAVMCPICSMKTIVDEDLLKFAIKKLDVSKDELKHTVTESFQSYDSFKEFINES